MALKDWKKTDLKNRILFENKKDKEKVIQVNTYEFNPQFEVLVGRRWHQAIIRKEFKTKQQALKFAKAYMRKH